MGDNSDSLSSIESEPDNFKADPTFTCNIQVVTPKLIRRSKRIIKSIADHGSKSLSAVES